MRTFLEAPGGGIRTSMLEIISFKKSPPLEGM